MVLQLAREQKRMGHDVTICCMYGAGPLDSRAVEFGLPVVHLHSKQTRFAKIRALYAYLGKNRYDVLHSHWEVWLGTAIAGYLRGIPRIHTNHGNHPRRLFMEHRLASPFTTKLVVLTPDVEPYIAKWVGVPARKIEVIPNGIELTRFDAATRVEIDRIPPEAPVVGMIARLSPPKDYPTLMRAAEIVAKTHPEAHFIGIGTGKQLEEFEAMAADLGLTNFHFLGGRSDVPRLLKRMTVNVLSTRQEGHPLSLVEALASRCAAIGSDIPSVRFTLEDGKSGLLVPGGDPAALAAAISRLLDDPALRESLAAHGWEYSRRFDVAQMARSYLDLYARVVAAKAE